MRRAALLLGPQLLALILLLPGCGSGFGDFVGDTFTIRRDVNAPQGDSLNLRRVRSQTADVPALQPEPGNIWPGPPKAEPTLSDLEHEGNPGAPEMPVPGSRLYQPQGSSTMPPSTSMQMPNPPVPGVAPRLAPSAAAPSAPSVLSTPNGPAVSTGNGSRAFQQYSSPRGPASGGILIPNGNGTSTLIHPDGSVETVPTAK